MIKIAWALSENSCDIININMEPVYRVLLSYNPVFSVMNAAIFLSRFRSVISNGRYVKPFLSRIMSRSRVTVW